MLELHGDPRSGHTRKVRWALAELGVSYEFRVVVLAKGEHRRPEMLAMNPNGKVPVLVDDGFVLWESDAILWHLAETRGGLLPAGVQQRGAVHQWMCWNAQHLGEVTFRARVLRMVALRTGVPFDQAKYSSILAGAPAMFAILDRHLAGKTFAVGDALSIADIALAMNVSMGLEEGAPLGGCDEVRRWHGELTGRRGYAAGSPV